MHGYSTALIQEASPLFRQQLLHYYRGEKIAFIFVWRRSDAQNGSDFVLLHPGLGSKGIAGPMGSAGKQL